jgi:hypothetical protein
MQSFFGDYRRIRCYRQARDQKILFSDTNACSRQSKPCSGEPQRCKQELRRVLIPRHSTVENQGAGGGLLPKYVYMFILAARGTRKSIRMRNYSSRHLHIIWSSQQSHLMGSGLRPPVSWTRLELPISDGSLYLLSLQSSVLYMYPEH